MHFKFNFECTFNMKIRKLIRKLKMGQSTIYNTKTGCLVKGFPLRGKNKTFYKIIIGVVLEMFKVSAA